MSDNGFLKIDGRNAYVVTERRMAGSSVSSWLVTAASLAEAKRYHGWTRQMYTTRSVRRARQADATLPDRSEPSQ